MKSKHYWPLGIKLFILCAIIFAIFACWLFHRNTVYVDDNMSLTYSRSVSSFSSTSNADFYVRNDVLYFAEKHSDSFVIRYVKNNIIHTLAKLPEKAERFVILHDKSAIVQIEDLLYLLNDGKLMELSYGNLVGCYENLVYFTDNTTLYEAEIGVREPQAVASFEELLAFYHDGIVYRNSEGIYQLLFEQINEPQLLTPDDIAWSNDKPVWLVGYEYLYTPDYALRIGSHTLDMYIYETGEMRRIYEADTDNMVLMAVTARGNELYVSRQYSDLKFWPLKDAAINGTYKYRVWEHEWTKISDKTYSVIEQFDEQYLYGMRANSLYGAIESIKVD